MRSMPYMEQYPRGRWEGEKRSGSECPRCFLPDDAEVILKQGMFRRERALREGD
jgi:hypothetical protein